MLRLFLSVILISVACEKTHAEEIHNSNAPARHYRLPAVEIKHTVKQGKLEFSARGSGELAMSVYLFEADGKLISQVALKNNHTVSLSAMPKGAYFFEIFSNDLRIKNGTVIIR